jgi:shikimate 5-dehydrogenase
MTRARHTSGLIGAGISGSLSPARELGCRTLDGGGMVVFQAADALELFTGLRSDRDRIVAHFQELAR